MKKSIISLLLDINISQNSIIAPLSTALESLPIIHNFPYIYISCLNFSKSFSKSKFFEALYKYIPPINFIHIKGSPCFSFIYFNHLSVLSKKTLILEFISSILSSLIFSLTNISILLI